MPLFFSYLCGGECLEDINTLVGHFRQKAWYSILSPFRKSKTSDFFEVNIRTFDAKHPYFCPKKSDVSDFRKHGFADYSLPTNHTG